MMGGMIAQALAVRHPAQVSPPGAVRYLSRHRAGRYAVADGHPQAGSDFPANQSGAFGAFKAAVAEYPSAARGVGRHRKGSRTWP